jgi:hypothetical protein
VKKLYDSTRDVGTLLKVGLGILVAGFLAAMVMVFSLGHHGGERALVQEYEEVLEELQEVKTERALAHWLRGYASYLNDDKELELPEHNSLPSALDLTELSAVLSPVRKELQDAYAQKLEALVKDARRRALFVDFVATTQGGREGEKIQRLAQQGVPFANEFLGSLQQRAGDKEAALLSYMKEALLPDAVQARAKALDLALDLEDAGCVLHLQAETPALQEAEGWRLTEAERFVHAVEGGG